MAECMACSLDELEQAVSQAGSALRRGDQANDEHAYAERYALKAFQDASRALDEAIESLGD